MNGNLLRDLENHFFATMFIGIGIIPVFLLFVWDASLGTIMQLTTLGVGDIFSADIFGTVMMNEIIGNLTLCVAH